MEDPAPIPSPTPSSVFQPWLQDEVTPGSTETELSEKAERKSALQELRRHRYESIPRRRCFVFFFFFFKEEWRNLRSRLYQKRQKDSIYMDVSPTSQRVPLAASGGGNVSSFKLGAWGISGGSPLGLTFHPTPPFLPCDSDTKYINYLVRKLIS